MRRPCARRVDPCGRRDRSRGRGSDQHANQSAPRLFATPRMPSRVGPIRREVAAGIPVRNSRTCLSRRIDPRDRSPAPPSWRTAPERVRPTELARSAEGARVSGQRRARSRAEGARESSIWNRSGAATRLCATFGDRDPGRVLPRRMLGGRRLVSERSLAPRCRGGNLAIVAGGSTRRVTVGGIWSYSGVARASGANLVTDLCTRSDCSERRDASTAGPSSGAGLPREKREAIAAGSAGALARAPGQPRPPPTGWCAPSGST